jgi:hypothetical protein
MEKTKGKPEINPTLLWEYDLETFNWDKSYKIVIERVIQLGNVKEWKEIRLFYGHEKILETAKWSKQLDKRDKDFTILFLKSDYLDVA